MPKAKKRGTWKEAHGELLRMFSEVTRQSVDFDHFGKVQYIKTLANGSKILIRYTQPPSKP